MLYHLQLEWIRWIHRFRSVSLDSFFEFFDFFDRTEFYFLLVPAIWMGVNWRWGLRLFFILSVSGLVNYGLKHLFLAPRPFHLDPSLGVIQVHGYGFPSGAAQSIVLLVGLLLNISRSRRTWIIAANMVFWVSLSRIYLGVHFFTDVLGGWAVGWGLWALCTYGGPPLERWLERMGPIPLFVFSQLLPFFLIWACPTSLMRRVASGIMGVGLGLFLSYRLKLLLPTSRKVGEGVCRALVGVLGACGIYLVTRYLGVGPLAAHSFVSFSLLGLWVSFGASWCWKQILNR